MEMDGGQNIKKVYCVMDADYEGSFLCSIWSTEQKAIDEVQRLKIIHDTLPHHWEDHHFVEEYNVDTQDGL